MTTTEPNTELSLAQKTVSNIKIETLLPEITLTLSLEDFTDFSKAAKLEVRKSTAVIFKEKLKTRLRNLKKTILPLPKTSAILTHIITAFLPTISCSATLRMKENVLKKSNLMQTFFLRSRRLKTGLLRNL